MGKPAARMGDMLSDAGMITGPGALTVLINKMPAARVGDFHTTPMVLPGTPPIPLVGGPIIGPGCMNVLICGMPAAVVGDMALTAVTPASIMMGSFNVFIGMNGSGGGSGGGGASAATAEAAQGLKAGTVSPVEGTESFPIEIQAAIIGMSKYRSPGEVKLQIQVIADALAQAGSGGAADDEENAELTIADFVEILKAIESEESLHAARFFAAYIDYGTLTELARDFISGENPDEKNDPNQMPTRFMILYGADDSKLKEIDTHPQSLENEEHKINIENLRKGLIGLGYEIAETGPYDDDVYRAHLQCIAALFTGKFNIEQTHIVEEGETLADIAHANMLPSWDYLYEVNKDIIGDNPDILQPGLELTIPQWDSTTGDEKIKEKGGDPFKYTGGLRYMYSWLPFSLTLTDDDATEYVEKNEDGNNREEYATPIEIEVYNSETEKVVAEYAVKAAAEVTVLVPASPNLAVRFKGEQSETPQQTAPTIAAFVESLEAVEQEQGLEAARHFAAALDYVKLCELSKNGGEGNDPNAMPTRFMVLWGADDTALTSADNHPDLPDGETHTINIANLRTALRFDGFDVEETGQYDDKLYYAYLQWFSNNFIAPTQAGAYYTTAAGDTLAGIALAFGLASWKYLYEYNKDIIGGNPDILEPGLNLCIPQWDSTCGDELLRQRGIDPQEFIGGLPFRYPWTVYSATFTDDSGAAYDNGQQTITVELKNRKTKETFKSITLGSNDELHCLGPVSAQMQMFIDGEEA